MPKDELIMDALEHCAKRVYEDFAKRREEIERMPEGERKAKALHIWYLLAELVSCNWEGTGANP